MKKVVLDTNLYIDWMNRGLHEELMLGSGMVRYLSAVVVMELRAGAHTRAGRLAIDHLVRVYAAGDRLIAPPQAVFDRAGSMLRRLKLAGREVRSASFVNGGRQPVATPSQSACHGRGWTGVHGHALG